MIKKLFVSLFTSIFFIFQSFAVHASLRSITQEEFSSYMTDSNTVIVDVRTPREYARGYIPGAINIPHKDIVSGKVSLEQYADKNIVLYCHSGVRANIVNQYLEKNPAFPKDKLLHLKGDFRAWQARRKPIIKP